MSSSAIQDTRQQHFQGQTMNKENSVVEHMSIRRTQSEITSSRSTIPTSSSQRPDNQVVSPSSILTNTRNSFTPITAHYDLNGTLYQAFFKICERKRYKLALSVGLQYCRVCLFDIPTHSYYHSPKYHNLKIESAKNAVHVSNVLCTKVIVSILKKEERNRLRAGKDDYSTRIYGQKNSSHSPPTSDLEDKFEEAKLLREVAEENMKIVQTRSSGREPSRGDSFLKKEVVQVEEQDDIPAWLRILDCGSSDSVINLCSNSLRKKDKVAAHSAQQRQKLGQTPQNQYPKQNEDDVLLNEFFGRTTSAPANLGKPPPTRSNSAILRHTQQPQDQDHESRENSLSIVTENPSLDIASVIDKRDDSDSHIPEKSKNDEQYESDLERALYLSGLEFQSSTNQDDCGKYSAHKNLKKVETEEVDIDTVSLIYQEDFNEMRNSDQICVSFVDTYQGRIPGSSNGCTVIAPLLAIHHLCNEKALSERSNILMSGKLNDSERSTEQRRKEQYSNPADDERIENSSSLEAMDKETIKMVIDVQAPLVLPKVRGGLGLHADALIIPSDVHDYFMNENMLHQNQFVDVFTGNILDDISLAKFIEAMAGAGAGAGSSASKDEEMVKEKKLAATLYFHEHVISVLRTTRTTYTSVRDLQTKVKPKKKSSRRALFKRRNMKQKKQQRPPTSEIPDYETIVDEETYFEIIDSLPGAAMLGREYSNITGKKYAKDSTWLPITARIRCCNMKSLHAALRWYACSKFTSEDQKFIDTYQWDHVNVDFDPRVFQGFIWSE